MLSNMYCIVSYNEDIPLAYYELINTLWNKYDVKLLLILTENNEDIMNKFKHMYFKPLDNIDCEFQKQCLCLYYAYNLNSDAIIYSSEHIPLSLKHYKLDDCYVYNNSKDTMPIVSLCNKKLPELLKFQDITEFINYLHDIYGNKPYKNRLYLFYEQILNSVRNDKIITDPTIIKLNKEQYKKDIKDELYSDMYVQDFDSYKHLINELLVYNFYINTIYVLHYTKLHVRKEVMLQLFKKERLDTQYNIIWIDQFDREILTKEMIQQNYVYNPYILGRYITMGEIANGIGHNYILQNLKGTCMVIEDDMVLCEHFLDKLYECMNKLEKTDWEIFGIGGYKDNFKIEIDNFVYNIDKEEMKLYVPQKSTVQTGNFIIKEELAKRITEHKMFSPFSAPIDYTLCYILPGVNAKVYRCDPLLSYEGSKVFFGTSFTDRGF